MISRRESDGRRCLRRGEHAVRGLGTGDIHSVDLECRPVVRIEEESIGSRRADGDVPGKECSKVVAKSVVKADPKRMIRRPKIQLTDLGDYIGRTAVEIWHLVGLFKVVEFGGEPGSAATFCPWTRLAAVIATVTRG